MNLPDPHEFPQWWRDKWVQTGKLLPRLAEVTGLDETTLRAHLTAVGITTFRGRPLRQCQLFEWPPAFEARPGQPDWWLSARSVERDQLTITCLPAGLLRDLAEDLGLNAARRLVAAAGGTQIYVPLKVEGSKAESMFGYRITRWLAEYWGSLKVFVPSAAVLANAQRAADVVLARRDGQTVAQVASRFGVSSRTVARYAASVRECPG